MTSDATSDFPVEDTFRPNVPDRFEKHVRDDHKANQILHDALQAANESDDDPVTYNLMATHAPGEKDHAPRYEVYATFYNEGGGHPIIEDPVRTLIEKCDVHVTGVVECSDDHLTVSFRPVESVVEPIEVRYRDLPNDVHQFETIRFNAQKVLSHAIGEYGSNPKTYEAASCLAVLLNLIDPDTERRSIEDGDPLEQLRWLSDKADAEWEFVDDEEYVEFPDMGVPCATYECTANATETQRYQFPSGYVVDLPLCDECFDDFDVDDVTSHPWQESSLHRTIEFGRGQTIDIPEIEDPEDARRFAAAVLREYNEAEYDVDDRAARIRATVGGDEYTDVVREKERMVDLPPDVDVYVDSVDAYDIDDDRAIDGDHHTAGPYRAVNEARDAAIDGGYFDPSCPECGYAPLTLPGSASFFKCPECGTAGNTRDVDGWSAFDALVNPVLRDAFDDGLIDPSMFDDGVGGLADYLSSKGDARGEDLGAPYRRAAEAARRIADGDDPRTAHLASDVDFPDGFVGYATRRTRHPIVDVAVQDKDDGSIVAKAEGERSGEWFEVDTGRGIYNFRVDVDHPVEEVEVDLSALKGLDLHGEAIRDGVRLVASEGTAERLGEAADAGILHPTRKGDGAVDGGDIHSSYEGGGSNE